MARTRIESVDWRCGYRSAWICVVVPRASSTYGRRVSCLLARRVAYVLNVHYQIVDEFLLNPCFHVHRVDQERGKGSQIWAARRTVVLGGNHVGRT